MELIIGSDHGGYELKEKLKGYLSKKGVAIIDVGTKSQESCDYPDIAKKGARKVLEKKCLGILICGTGIGISIAANKIKGIRAALCYNEYTSKMAREHNDANILCLGGRTTLVENAKKIVDVFLNTSASLEERHKKRVNKICKLE